ncbi:MAG TPA: hypothetical protein VNA28_17750 [Solirubrobacteraceae bacterium]|nr:hypothetical protein [Solirubrobacteraceae bacterium]
MATVSPPFGRTATTQQVIDDPGDDDWVWSCAGIDIPVPHWLAEILAVQPMVRLEILLIGICCGLIIGATALFLAIYITMY